MPDQEGLLADIRRQRDRLLDEKRWLHLAVPHWPGLIARYERISSRAERAKIIEKVSPDLDNVQGEMELMLRANVGVLARDEDGEDHLLAGQDGKPLTLRSPELAAQLGLDAESPMELILQMFADRDGRSDLDAIATHADRVAAWMDRTSLEVEVHLAGESGGGETSNSSHEQPASGSAPGPSTP